MLPGKDDAAFRASLYIVLGDVWSIRPQLSHTDHTATYPVELCRRAIKATCPPNGTVLDMFAGTGTTGDAALELGRQFIGIELNEGYAKIMANSLGLELMAG